MIVFYAIISGELRGVASDEVTSRQAYRKRRNDTKTVCLYAVIVSHLVSFDQKLGEIRND